MPGEYTEHFPMKDFENRLAWSKTGTFGQWGINTMSEVSEGNCHLSVSEGLLHG